MDAGRFAGADVKDAAIENHRRLSLWCRGFTLPMLVVRSEPLYDAMNDHDIPERNRCVICKRFMMQVGSGLVRRQHALALVTGENLGQVASQTLSNIAVIALAADVLVLRPLITYDKRETVDIARAIGTFEAHPKDLACRAVPRMPTTAADPTEILACERQLDLESIVSAALHEPSVVLARNGHIRMKEKDS
jgi:thiamine biosynthesis protein ThiI